MALALDSNLLINSIHRGRSLVLEVRAQNLLHIIQLLIALYPTPSNYKREFRLIRNDKL